MRVIVLLLLVLADVSCGYLGKPCKVAATQAEVCRCGAPECTVCRCMDPIGCANGNGYVETVSCALPDGG